MEWMGLFIVMNDMGNSVALCHIRLMSCPQCVDQDMPDRNIPNRLPFVLLASTQVDDYC